MSANIIRLAETVCCPGRESASTARVVAVDRRATGSLVSATTDCAANTPRAPRPEVAGYLLSVAGYRKS